MVRRPSISSPSRYCTSSSALSSFLFFFNDTATTEIYTLSLHDALPIWASTFGNPITVASGNTGTATITDSAAATFSGAITLSNHNLQVLAGASTLTLTGGIRSEEHTSELQSLTNLVCRLLLEKKKKYH